MQKSMLPACRGSLLEVAKIVGLIAMSDHTCHRALRRFWFPLTHSFGIDVTAATEAEARSLAEEARGRYMPEAEFTGVVPDVDIQTLDAKHVIPNAGPSVVRGVWYPRLNI